MRANAADREPGAAQGPSPAPRGRSALPRYLLAAGLARLADDGARVALVLLALERTGSATFGGLLVAALLVTHVGAAPVAGALADRVARRRAFHAGALVAFGGALALCALLVWRVPTASALAVAAVGGCAGPLLTGGLTSLLRDLAPAAVERAYRLDVVANTAAGIGGPALAAAAASLVGPGAATLALAGSAGVGALLVAGLPLPGRDPSAPAQRIALTRGIGALWWDRPLRAVTVASTVGQLGIGGLPVAAALLGRGPDDAATAGAYLAALAAGALLGSLAYARRPVGAGAPEWVVVACLVATAVPLACASLVSGVAPTLLLFGLAGLVGGPLDSSLFVVRDRGAPAEAHAQVFTLGAGLRMTAAAVGSGLAGVFAGVGGDGLLLATAGCQLLGATSGALLLTSRAPRRGGAPRRA